MSRNLIEANRSVFGLLDNHCALRGTPLKNADAPRWISSERMHRHLMINAKIGEFVHFGPSRKLLRVNLSETSYIISVGFDKNRDYLRDQRLDLDPAFLTVALSELQPRPVATLAEIREVVEWSDKRTDAAYAGHDFERVASLFPAIHVYVMPQKGDGATWNYFFRACVDECDLGSSWIEGTLVSTLRSMCDLDEDRIPYRVLCRSIFDGDKSSFFLALYRCLEALYGYSSAHSLAKALNIATPWAEVATALEEELGWHPREEGSLIRIVKFASRQDLASILICLGLNFSSNNDEMLVNQAAKAIYNLRNSIVHYRPAQHRMNMEKYDWLTICDAMVGIVLDVYEAVFSGKSA